jgi:putative ABC transport system ATP-binding protein/lipoprotein-releasing system ATP-binding protein
MIIRLEQVSKTYPLSEENIVPAIREVDLQVMKGDFLILTGRSGSGKTTLLNLIAGLVRPSTGKVWLYGKDLWTLPDREQSRLRNEKIGFVFQFPSLLPVLTVLENVTLPALFGGKRETVSDQRKARELLESTGLGDKLNVYPRQLSAGQQQRVVIARALLHEPEILIADEPTSDLDEQTEIEIMDLLRAVHAETGVTIVMVTHTTQLVPYGTRALQLESGRIRPDSGAGDESLLFPRLTLRAEKPALKLTSKGQNLSID